MAERCYCSLNANKESFTTTTNRGTKTADHTAYNYLDYDSRNECNLSRLLTFPNEDEEVQGDTVQLRHNLLQRQPWIRNIWQRKMFCCQKKEIEKESFCNIPWVPRLEIKQDGHNESKQLIMEGHTMLSHGQQRRKKKCIEVSDRTSTFSHYFL